MKTENKERALLASGEDVLDPNGIRHVRGRGIVSAGHRGWSQENKSWLQLVNKRMKGYLLVIPQTAIDYAFHFWPQLMGVETTQLSNDDCCNAAAVLECQSGAKPGDTFPIDHTENHRGSANFSGTGVDSKIMFLGAPMSRHDSILAHLPASNELGECIKVYDIEWEMAVHDNGQGEIWLIGEANAPEFTAQQIKQWALDLRDWANAESKLPGDIAVVDSLYEVSNCLPDGNGIELDPFKIELLGLSEQYDADNKPIIPPDDTALIPHLKNVLAYGPERDEYFTESYLCDYLTKLISHLQQKLDDRQAN